MQKLKKLVALLLLCTLFAFSSMPLTPFDRGDNQAAYAQGNTIILEMGSASSDDIRDLRYSQGKLFNQIEKTIEKLKDSGDVGENAQPIIVVVKKKSASGW